MAGSKNNPNNKNNIPQAKLVYSSDCEQCQKKCLKGIDYLRVFAIRHEGKGVVCKKDI